MKRIFALLAFVLFSGSSAYAATGNYNLRFSPLGALVGMVDVNFDVAIGPNLVVGPSLTYWNVHIFDVDAKVLGFGAEGNYFFDGVFNDGVYMDFGASMTNIDVSAKSDVTGETASAKASGVAYHVGVGYAWFWESFNINLGLNVGGTTINKIEIKDSTGTTVEEYNGRASAGVDFKFGFVF